MNTRRFVGATSRAVLQQVRRELGAEAVILSNRQTREGIEILALSQNEMSRLLAAPGRTEPAPQAARAASAERAAANAPVPLRAFVKQSAARPAAARPAAPAPSAPAQGEGLLREIRAVQGLLREQIAAVAWGESARKRPLRALLLRELVAAGFAPALGRTIVERLPDDFAEPQARKWLAGVLEKNLHCRTDDEITQRGGVYALVGPTGVGKTTTVAKLAARFAMKHGAQHLGLVTTDNYRIGAQEQLRAYGKILGVPVLVAQDALELRHAISGLSGKRLILVDTIGMSQRDPRVAEQHKYLDEARVRRILLLGATSQSDTLQEVVAAYRGATGLAGAIITKLDEASSSGNALDAAIRHHLELRYVATGQRVPEDLHIPDPVVLVHRALKSAARSLLKVGPAELSLLLAPGGAPQAAAHA
jgi:flagellar biosynthesis protein FlhF